VEDSKKSSDRDQEASASIRFLGLCRRATQSGFSWDLIGLSQVVYFPYLPQKLSGLIGVIAVDKDFLGANGCSEYRIILSDSSDSKNRAWSSQTLAYDTGEVPSGEQPRHSFPVPRNGAQHVSASILVAHESLHGEGTVVVAYPAPPLIIWRPTLVNVEVEIGGTTHRLGEFACEFARPQPISEEERRALSARPHAAKAVRLGLRCNLCGQGIQLVCSLDPNETIDPEDVLVGDAADKWRCACEPPREVDLQYAKLGLHDVLRHPVGNASSNDDALGYVPLYEAGRVSQIAGEFDALIRATPREEDVQKFMEANPLIWNFLSPRRILHKPKILTKKNADFGILTNAKILFLVEIEKPSTKLTNKDGGISAEINKGANQIRDWKQVVGKHRNALLDELGFKPKDVQTIRYLLVGGLTHRTTPDGLTKLRDILKESEFYCFDELGAFLRSTASTLERL